MIISDKGIALLKELEACDLTAYQDGGGVWTIGYGSTSNVVQGMVITQSEAEARLMHKLAEFNNIVSKAVKQILTQNQFDALVIFTYNIGGAAFEKSTMLKLINTGSFLAAAEQFPKWNKDNGKVVKGLVNRRAAERKLFETV